MNAAINNAVNRLEAGESVLFVVSITDVEATTYDLVKMTEEQGRQMASELERAKERRRIVDYDVWFVIDGVREHGEYAERLSEWLVPGERKPSKEQK